MLKRSRWWSSLSSLVKILVIALALYGLFAPKPLPAEAQNKTGWSLPKTISDPQERASDPYLVLDPPNNRLHVFWASERVEPNGSDISVIFYAYKDLISGAWSTPADILTPRNGQDAYAIRAILDGEGTIHLFFSTSTANMNAAFGPLYYTSTPALRAAIPAAWRPQVEIAQGTYMNDVQIDSQGYIHMVYASVIDGEGICHMVSGDNGENWEQTSCFPQQNYLRDEEAHTRPRLAIDHQDHLHVVWELDDYSSLSILRYGGRALMYARSTDGGKTWENIHTIDKVDGRVREAPFYSSDDVTESLRTLYNPPITDDLFQPEWPFILVDHANRIHINWIGSAHMTRMHMYSGDGGNTWSEPVEAMPVVYFNGWMGLINDSADKLYYISAGREGVWFATWTAETGWSETVNIDMVGPEMGYVYAVVWNGNHLFVVYQKENAASGGGGARTVMVTELETGSPNLPFQAPPVRQMTPPPVTHQPTPTSNLPLTPTPRPTFGPDQPVQNLDSPSLTIFISLLPVMLILGAIILVPKIIRRQ